jgi:hypothetical protein
MHRYAPVNPVPQSMGCLGEQGHLNPKNFSRKAKNLLTPGRQFVIIKVCIFPSVAFWREKPKGRVYNFLFVSNPPHSHAG